MPIFTYKYCAVKIKAMKYQALKHKTINLAAKAEYELDSVDAEVTLVPNDGDKVFIHWKNQSGKLMATYTMTFPTRIDGKVTLINALTKPASVRIIW
jgi:hypothetical protein